MLSADSSGRHRHSARAYQNCCIFCPCYGCCPRMRAEMRCRRKDKDILQ